MLIEDNQLRQDTTTNKVYLILNKDCLYEDKHTRHQVQLWAVHCEMSTYLLTENYLLDFSTLLE